MVAPVADSISARLALYRERAGLSRLKLARLMGYERATTIDHWESGRRLPTPENLDRLAGILKCRVGDLDPQGDAFTPERRRAVLTRGKTLQKSQTSTETPTNSRNFAPQVGVGMADVEIPDPDLYLVVYGKFLTLRTRAQREEFAAYVELFTPRSSQVKTRR